MITDVEAEGFGELAQVTNIEERHDGFTYLKFIRGTCGYESKPRGLGPSFELFFRDQKAYDGFAGRRDSSHIKSPLTFVKRYLELIPEMSPPGNLARLHLDYRDLFDEDFRPFG